MSHSKKGTALFIMSKVQTIIYTIRLQKYILDLPWFKKDKVNLRLNLEQYIFIKLYSLVPIYNAAYCAYTQWGCSLNILKAIPTMDN